MIGIGVVGYGYWGPNLVRNLAELQGSCQVIAVADLSAERLARLQARYPSVQTTTDYGDLLANQSIDAIVVATPVATHFDLAMRALQSGRHVLCEKPLADTSEHAARLLEEADRRNLVLMVDHTFVYTGAVRQIKALLDEGQLGQVLYYDSVRVNLGLFQHDVNVLWDLAVHDLSIMDYLLDRKPTAVAATAIAHVAGQPENLAYLTCFFADNLIAHIAVNWLAPVKIRRALIGGDSKMIVYDDLEPSEKIKVYDKGISVTDDPDGIYKMLVGYRTGDMWAPQLDPTEALRVEALHFIESIAHGSRPITGGEVGWRVVRLLEAASRSVAAEGRPIELNWDH